MGTSHACRAVFFTALVTGAVGQGLLQPHAWPTPALYTSSPVILDTSSFTAPPGYTSQSAARAVAVATSAAVLGNWTMRVGVAVNFVCPSLGADNLVRFASTTAPGYVAWCQTTPGTAVRIARSDVTGQMTWLMDFVSTWGLAGVEWYAVSLPPSLVNASDSTLKALWMINALGMDTALYGMTVTPPRLQYLAFSQPFTFYSHQLVARRATVALPSLNEKLWHWTRPFTWDMWLALVALLVLQSLTYFYYEHSSEVDNMVHQERRRGIVRAYSYAVFLVAMSVVGTNNHVPTSISGRVYTAVAAFVIWICMASYISNLASLLSARPTAVQTVTGLDMFNTQPLCVRNNSIQLRFLASQLPSAQYIITGPTTESMLQGVLSGLCRGGIDDELILRWTLGAGDPTGAFCGIDTVGSPTQGAYPFGLPFPMNTSRVSKAQVDAVSVAIAAALYDGNYSAAESIYLPKVRPLGQCAAYLANVGTAETSGIQPLSLTDMAGVFIIGVAAVVLTACGRIVKRRVRRTSFGSSLARMTERASITLLGSTSDLARHTKAAAAAAPEAEKEQPQSRGDAVLAQTNAGDVDP